MSCGELWTVQAVYRNYYWLLVFKGVECIKKVMKLPLYFGWPKVP